MNKNSNNVGCLGFIIMLPLLPIILPFAIIAGLFSPSKTNKSKSKYTEEELNAYGLWEDEKELVRKGEYDPWNFEENEMLDDDDYYKDDVI